MPAQHAAMPKHPCEPVTLDISPKHCPANPSTHTRVVLFTGPGLPAEGSACAVQHSLQLPAATLWSGWRRGTAGLSGRSAGFEPVT